MSAGFFDARGQEKCRPPFSGADRRRTTEGAIPSSGALCCDHASSHKSRLPAHRLASRTLERDRCCRSGMVRRRVTHQADQPEARARVTPILACALGLCEQRGGAERCYPSRHAIEPCRRLREHVPRRSGSQMVAQPHRKPDGLGGPSPPYAHTSRKVQACQVPETELWMTTSEAAQPRADPSKCPKFGGTPTPPSRSIFGRGQVDPLHVLRDASIATQRGCRDPLSGSGPTHAHFL